MRKLFSSLLFGLMLLLPINISAAAKEEIPPVQNDWDKEEDGNLLNISSFKE